MTKQELFKIIKEAFEKSGMTKKEFSNRSGIVIQRVNHYLAGEVNVSYDLLESMLKVLNLEIYIKEIDQTKTT